MQNKMECDWFKSRKHEVTFKNSQPQNSQQKLNLKATNPTKTCSKNNCVFDIKNKMRDMHNRKHSK